MSQRKPFIFLICLLWLICFSARSAKAEELQQKRTPTAFANGKAVPSAANPISSRQEIREAMRFNKKNRVMKLLRLTNPREQRVEGLTKASCIAVDQSKICHGLTDESSTGSLFVVLKNETRLNSWPGRAFLGNTSSFEVLQGDMDGDGKLETIIANHDGQSNGMGVNYWTIYILPWSKSAASLKPLQFFVEDYGANGTFILNKKTKEIEILATRWEWGWQTSPAQKDGLYLVGRWFKYQDEMLTPIEKPIVVRRYLRAFEKERLRTINRNDIPYLWLKNPSSETRAKDNIEHSSTELGVIESIFLAPSMNKSDSESSEDAPESLLLSLNFKPDSGKVSMFFYATDDSENKNVINLIGEEAKHAIYPVGYLPSAPETWLKGRRAKISTYARGDNGQRFVVLWID